jgi:hypothetical protein
VPALANLVDRYYMVIFAPSSSPELCDDDGLLGEIGVVSGDCGSKGDFEDTTDVTRAGGNFGEAVRRILRAATTWSLVGGNSEIQRDVAEVGTVVSTRRRLIRKWPIVRITGEPMG